MKVAEYTMLCSIVHAACIYGAGGLKDSLKASHLVNKGYIEVCQCRMSNCGFKFGATVPVLTHNRQLQAICPTSKTGKASSHLFNLPQAPWNVSFAGIHKAQELKEPLALW